MFTSMKKKAARTKTYVELTAVWGNDDADSTIRVSPRRWKAIQQGAKYRDVADSWYEGTKALVGWHFKDGKVSVHGDDGAEWLVGMPVEDLIVQIVTSGKK
jgi:hypothetical protein